MYILPTLYDKNIFPDKTADIINNWTLRKTVKIVLQNTAGQIGLITNAKHKLYLLPGGGVNEGEDFLLAANRESIEETNYSIKNPKIFLSLEEYRSRKAEHYHTYGIVAGTNQFFTEDFRTNSEIQNGHSVEWFSVSDSIDILKKQVSLLKEGKINFYNTSFNVLRDYLILEKAIEAKLLF